MSIMTNIPHVCVYKDIFTDFSACLSQTHLMCVGFSLRLFLRYFHCREALVLKTLDHRAQICFHDTNAL